MNARFWAWWNDGWVKITLEPDQSIELHYDTRTSEGWHQHYERYSHGDDCVICEMLDVGADCDGRYEEFSEHYARLENLKEKSAFERNEVPENVGIFTPGWERGISTQRDYAAEAMGY